MCNCPHNEFELLPELEVTLDEYHTGFQQRIFRALKLEDELGAVKTNHKKTDRTLPYFIFWVKQSLNKLLGVNLSVNSDMDVQTQKAIKNLQIKKGLSPDGNLNYKTLKALYLTKVQSLPEPLLKQRLLRGPMLPNKTLSAAKINLQRELQELQFDLLGPIAAGIGIVQSVIELEKDVIWYKTELEREAIYPFNQMDKFNQLPWKPNTIVVKQSLQAKVPRNLVEWELADVVFATFAVKYHYNGHAIGYISLEKIGADCGIGNSLTIMQGIHPDPNTYAMGNEKPLAMLEVTFNYTFKSIFSQPLIWMAKYQLYGNGKVAMENKWVQGNPDFAYDTTERKAVLKGKQPVVLH